MTHTLSTASTRLLGIATLALALMAPQAGSGGDATALLKDINPGAGASNPRFFVKAGEGVYFSAADGTDGYMPHLWRTDGTPGGTTVVPNSPRAPALLTPVGETLFFQGYDAEHGYELWKFEPASGAFTEYDIDPGVGHSSPEYLTAFQGTVFFRARDGAGYGLWKAGPDGVELVKRLSVGYYDGPFDMTVMGDHLFFIARDPQDQHSRLWRTSGDPEDVRAVGPTTLALSTLSSHLTTFGGALYFGADDQSDPLDGWELWTSDGDPDDPSGTRLVLDLYPGTSSFSGVNSGYPGPFAVLNGVVHFAARTAEGLGLWRTDGTLQGTALIKNVSPLGNQVTPTLTPAGGLLFFVNNDGVTGRELWRSDGTFAGTFLVEDICNVFDYPNTALVCGPWVVAGEAHNSSNPTGLTAHAGKIYFNAYHPVHGRELFRSDGSTVELVGDFFGGTSYHEYWQQDFPNSSFATPTGEVDGSLYFSADDGVLGLEPWTLQSRTPEEEVAGLIEDVEGLIGDALNEGQGHSLLVKLDLALEALEAGDTQGAVSMLEAFVHEVHAFENAGKLTEEVARDLVETAEGVIGSISG